MPRPVRLFARLLAGLLAGLLAACAAPAAPGQCGLTLASRLALQPRGGLPMLSVGINGHTARMVLDTGAAGMVLNQEAVIRLGLRSDPRAVIGISGVGGESHQFAAIVTGLRLGGLALPDQRAAVLSAGLKPLDGERPDGLLGMDVLRRFDLDLDLPHSQLTLYRGRPCPDQPLPMPGPATVVEAAITNQGHLVMRAAVDQRPVLALLDTGARATVLSARAAGVPAGVLAADPPATLVGVGPAPVIARRHRFASATIGGETFADPVLIVLNDTPPDHDLIVGMDYLHARRLWISPAAGRIYVQRPPPH
ncbi:MAG: hypothetical protein BGP12_06315 [Rhodospirillales bacterium 70-18]|nr:aspartyl protease family protein [Rhodospirillales bacterium]OJY77040.1 MAG: hypothetical protein BGP12_06315 [Rhodospirillales bacterium 70-18]